MFPKLAPGRVSFSPEVSAFLALAALVLLSSCKRAAEPPAPEVRPVRVMTVAKGMAGDTVALTGTVQAQTEINQSFRIDGRMLERLVNVGDTVREGQFIARLDSQNEESGLQSARALLAAARAQQVEARSNFGRMRDLVAESAVSRATFEQAEAMQKTADSQVESAQSQVSLAENRLSYTRLMSTAAGIVTAQGAEAGEVVGAGRMIVQIAREDGRDATFDVPAQIKDSVPPNADITVTLSMNPAVSATGRVREVSPRADPVTGTFRVKVGLKKPPAAMRLGSTVTGRVKLETASGISIPASALVRSDRQTAVWVVDPKETTVSSRAISVAESTAGTIAVASGLNPGDIVVTAGVQALRPGQKVRLAESKQ